MCGCGSTAGARPQGVRRVESLVPAFAREMEATLAAQDPQACAAALQAATELYRRLRVSACAPSLGRRGGAEEAAVAHLRALRDRGFTRGE